MKQTRTEYNCDVCGKAIDENMTATDFSGRNFGVCADCRKRGYALQRTTVPAGPGPMVHITHPQPQPAQEHMQLSQPKQHGKDK